MPQLLRRLSGTLGQDVADGLVIVGGDGADLGDFLAVLGEFGDLVELGDAVLDFFIGGS